MTDPIPSRVQRWLDESRTLDRILGWIERADARRGQRNAQRVKDARAKARAAR